MEFVLEEAERIKTMGEMQGKEWKKGWEGWEGDLKIERDRGVRATRMIVRSAARSCC
jgi:hypothetical protein